MSLPSQLAKAGVLAVVFFLIGRKLAPMRRSAKGTFVLSVRVKFASQAELDAFAEIFRPLAEYVRKHERDTVFYEMAQADQKPFEVLIHERYTTRAAFEEVHRVSVPFLEFKRRVAALPFTVTFDGVSYEELGYGFV